MLPDFSVCSSPECGSEAMNRLISLQPHSEIERYLSSNDTQTLLGVDPQAGGNFSVFSPPVNAAFSARLDSLSFPAQHYRAALLERGIPVLLYAGDTDFACNYVSPSFHLTSHVCFYQLVYRLG